MNIRTLRTASIELIPEKVGFHGQKLIMSTIKMVDFHEPLLYASEIYNPEKKEWVTLETFLLKYAYFEKINDSKLVIFNKGTGLFDSRGMLRKKPEFRLEFLGDQREGVSLFLIDFRVKKQDVVVPFLYA
jgi:hypothetical protein